jgi:hypothetical protein
MHWDWPEQPGPSVLAVMFRHFSVIPASPKDLFWQAGSVQLKFNHEKPGVAHCVLDIECVSVSWIRSIELAF